MLLIKAKVGPNKIEGLGLFAAKPLKAGQEFWRFEPNFDLFFTAAQIAQLPPLTREFIKRYAYLDPYTKKYFLCTDDARFVNHSPNPNILSEYETPDGRRVARRDIAPGEELTINYETFDVDFKNYSAKLN